MSRPSLFTILYFYEVYIPLNSVKFVSSAHLSMRLACCTCCNWGVVGDVDLVGKGVTKTAPGRLEVSLSLTDKRASKSQMGKALLLACLGI